VIDLSRGIFKRSRDIVALEIWIAFENVGFRRAARRTGQDRT
jgi:hypothetical protein